MRKLVRNAIRCKHCGELLVSKTVHDFEQCSCGTCFNDGGLEYLRRGFKTSPEDDFVELSEYDDVPGYHVEYINKYLADLQESGYETDLPESLDQILRRFPQSEYLLKITDEDGNIVLNTIDNKKEVN